MPQILKRILTNRIFVLFNARNLNTLFKQVEPNHWLRFRFCFWQMNIKFDWSNFNWFNFSEFMKHVCLLFTFWIITILICSLFFQEDLHNLVLNENFQNRLEHWHVNKII